MQPAPAATRRFTGFSPCAFDLLRELALNNKHSWFAAHRPALEQLLVRPSLALIEDLGPLLRSRLSAGIRAEPHVGGSLLRLRKDARFVRGSPFRTHLELWFWEGRGRSSQHPGCFFRLTPDSLVLGGGMTTFPTDMLARYRRRSTSQRQDASSRACCIDWRGAAGSQRAPACSASPDRTAPTTRAPIFCDELVSRSNALSRCQRRRSMLSCRPWSRAASPSSSRFISGWRSSGDRVLKTRHDRGPNRDHVADVPQ